MRDPQVKEKEDELLKQLYEKKISQEDVEEEIIYLQRRQVEFDRGVKLAEDIADIVNIMNHEDAMRGFMHKMKYTHRTLQQSSFGMFLKWVYFIAKEYKDCDVDLRNQDTVNTARKIVSALGTHGDYLSFI